MRPINIPYNGLPFCEKQTNTKRATPGLALNGAQLEEMAFTGRVSTAIKQPIFEPGYNIDNPNPMRAPNVDIVDARSYSNELASSMERAIGEYNALVKKFEKSKFDSTKTPPAPAVQEVRE